MTDAPTPVSRRDSRWVGYLRLGGLAVATIVIIVFMAQNSASVALHFFGATFSAPLWLILLIVAVLGILIGWLVAWQRMRRRE
jgi:uncharacterized integral membrane protein